jgi:hypothetical protein
MTEKKIGKIWINGKLVYYPDYLKEACKPPKRRKRKKKGDKNDKRFIHGMGSKKRGVTPTYWTWQKIKNYYMFKKRTTGIDRPFHPAWLEDKTGFLNFLQDMGEKPSRSHKLRLLVKNDGHIPGNCIWKECGKVSIICRVCGVEFVKWRSKRDLAKYCSNKCKRERNPFKKRPLPQ